MAKVTLAEAIVNEINNSNGAVTKVEDGKFNKAVRSMDAGDPLAKGDIISIPEDYQVLQTIINPNAENPTPTPFIMVEVKNEETGAEKNMRFFPNQLAKIVFPLDNDGKRLPKVKTTGTAAKHFAGFQDVDEAMASLKGRKIKVTEDTVYRTERYGDRQVVNTHIYNYDLV